MHKAARKMNKLPLNIYLALFFVGIILITQSTKAEEYQNPFPNLSVSSTYNFFLDIDGNSELFVTVRIKNIEYDYNWYPNEYLLIPITISSFSEERPYVTNVTFANVTAKYDVGGYDIDKLPDGAYIHTFKIRVFSNYVHTFPKDAIGTFRAKIKFNRAVLKQEDYNEFKIPDFFLPKDQPPFKEYSDFVIRVNLPNDPYYYVEVLDTRPIYDYRIPFGRSESLEWTYKGDQIQIPFLFIDYRIHPDPLRQELDKATMTSLEYAKEADFWGKIALVIALISIPSTILAFPQVIQESKKFLKWLEEKWNNRP